MRPYLYSGLYIILASIGLWFGRGFIPIAEVSLFLIIFGGIGMGIGLVIGSWLYPEGVNTPLHPAVASASEESSAPEVT